MFRNMAFIPAQATQEAARETAPCWGSWWKFTPAGQLRSCLPVLDPIKRSTSSLSLRVFSGTQVGLRAIFLGFCEISKVEVD